MLLYIFRSNHVKKLRETKFEGCDVPKDFVDNYYAALSEKRLVSFLKGEESGARVGGGLGGGVSASSSGGLSASSAAPSSSK